MLAPALRTRIEIEAGWPVLDRSFRSSVPQIHLVDFPAEGRFGPIARFVGGTTFAAERIAGTLGASTHRTRPLAA